MSKINKILIMILSILTMIVIVVGMIIFLKKNNKQDNISKVATTTLEERKEWSNFLSINPYISEMEITEGYLLDDTELIKLAITSDEIKTESIVREEIEKMPTLTKGDGYKKTIESINQYIEKRILNAKIAYNFVETYVENNQYIQIGEGHIFFTKIKLPEREYIAIDLKKDGDNFETKIYEYEINEGNKEAVTTMLETGIINQEIQKSKTYTITGTMKDGEICIATKK